MLKAPDVPAVLIELGYLSNPRDCAQMGHGAWRDRVAVGHRGRGGPGNCGRFHPLPRQRRSRGVTDRLARAIIAPHQGSCVAGHNVAPDISLARTVSLLAARARRRWWRPRSTSIPRRATCRAWRRCRIISRRSRHASMPATATLLGEYARERRIFVPIAFVPKLVINAFTSAEDKNFFSHPGIDPSGILRAAVKDVFNVLEHKRLEGASTITQQVAKNFLLNSEVKFSRKIKEAILAIRIDCHLFEAEDPRALSERDFSGREFLRRRGGGAELFRQVARPARHLRSGVPRAACRRRPAITIRASTSRPRSTAATGSSARWPRTATSPTTRPGRDRRAACHPDAAAGHPGRGRRLFRRGGAPHPLHEVWRTRALRRRPAGALHAGCAAAELCRERFARRPRAL